MCSNLIKHTLSQQQMVEVFVLNGWNYILGCAIRLAKMVLIVFPLCCLGIDFQRKPLKKILPKTFFCQPFKYWNDATRNFKNHSGKSGSSSICLYSSTAGTFLSIQEQLLGKIQPIDVLISENRRNKISENRKKLIYLRPAGEGANIDRRLVPYTRDARRTKSCIEFIYLYIYKYASTAVLMRAHRNFGSGKY